MLRRLPAVLLLLAAAALLGGCVAIKSIVPSHNGVVVGPVQIQVTICANDVDSAPHAGCPFQTNSSLEAVNDTYQVLLGFRLPNGVTAPQSFVSTAGEALTFTRSPSYEKELTRLVPPPDGRVWVGYLSSQYTLAYSGAETARESTVAPAFGLPRPADGGPFLGSFAFRPVVGGRQVGDTGEPLSTDPVNCGEGIDSLPTVCIDHPLEAQLGTDISAGQPVDAGILAGKGRPARARASTCRSRCGWPAIPGPARWRR